jgi:hypothetical protein
MPGHPSNTVFPDGSAINKSLVRAMHAERVAFRLEDADELRAMDTAGARLFIIDGVLWQYDPSDTTSPDNGTTILVSNDGDRYDRVIAEIPYIGLVPQGRLTLTSATPVLTSTVSGAGTVYYALHTGNLIPITPDGTGFKMRVFAQLSNVLSDSATGKAGPAAAANDSNYDLFAWDDAGTVKLTRGPAWTSDTARGTGAGTSELARLGGVWVNAVAITNGPLQNRGTYLGTVRTNGTATVDVNFGAAAAGGTAAVLGVWNAYNRLPSFATVNDTTDSWAYTTGAFRPYNNSAGNRISFVRGMNDDAIAVDFLGGVSLSSGSAQIGAAIGLDSTSAAVGVWAREFGLVGFSTRHARYRGLPGLGFHFVQALEYGAANATFYGDFGGTAATGLAAHVTW